jgi:hypothetical protein
MTLSQHFTRARVGQIMNLVNLAPDIQEHILFLPRTEVGRHPIILADLQQVAAFLDWLIPPDDGAWDQSVTAFRTGLQAMQDLVADPATDLFAPLPHGKGQTVLREALLVADHNAYHIGQMVVVRRLLGAWEEEG